MAKVTVLDLVVTSDSGDAVKGFDAVGKSAKSMGSDVKTASRDIDTGASRIDGAAEASDNLASKSSQATGGLGALAAGFSLVGAEKYAVGLESAAMATDFFSGVGDISNLVLQSSIVLKIKDAAASATAAVKTGVMTVATKAAAAGQWLLNAALTANPIGIVVVALVAVAAALAVAYTKSDSFRAIVQTGFAAVVEATKAVGQWIGNLVGWFRDKLPAAGRIAKTLIVGYIKLITLPIRTVITIVTSLAGFLRDNLPAAFAAAKDKIAGTVTAVKDKIQTIVDKGKDVATWFRTNLSAGFVAAKDKIKEPVTVVTGWIEDLVEVVRDLVGWIGDIKFPKPPGWVKDLGGAVNPFNKAGSPGGGAMSGGDTYTAYITIEGAIDPLSTANQIDALLNRRATWNGRVVTVTS